MMLVFLVFLLLFGANKIPEMAKGLGKGLREFKKATDDIKRELSEQYRWTLPRKLRTPLQISGGISAKLPPILPRTLTSNTEEVKKDATEMAKDMNNLNRYNDADTYFTCILRLSNNHGYY